MEGATYINFDKARTTGMRLIRNKENPTAGLLIVAGINLGLRIGDLLTLTYGQLRQDEIQIMEKKTRNKKNARPRVLEINDNIKAAMNYFPENEYPNNFHAFRSQKNTVYSIQHVNRLLKKYFPGNRISSHSLRKTFGRRVWDNDGQSERALTYLNQIFNHVTMLDTKKYLGIQQEEISNIYRNL